MTEPEVDSGPGKVVRHIIATLTVLSTLTLLGHPPLPPLLLVFVLVLVTEPEPESEPALEPAPAHALSPLPGSRPPVLSPFFPSLEYSRQRACQCRSRT